MGRIYTSIDEVKLCHPRYSDERARIVYENSLERQQRKYERELKKKEKIIKKMEQEVFKEPEPKYQWELGEFRARLCDWCYINFKKSAYDITEEPFKSNFDKLNNARRRVDIPEIIAYFDNLMWKEGKA